MSSKMIHCFSTALKMNSKCLAMSMRSSGWPLKTFLTSSGISIFCFLLPSHVCLFTYGLHLNTSATLFLMSQIWIIVTSAPLCCSYLCNLELGCHQLRKLFANNAMPKEPSPNCLSPCPDHFFHSSHQIPKSHNSLNNCFLNNHHTH